MHGVIVPPLTSIGAVAYMPLMVIINDSSPLTNFSISMAVKPPPEMASVVLTMTRPMADMPEPSGAEMECRLPTSATVHGNQALQVDISLAY